MTTFKLHTFYEELLLKTAYHNLITLLIILNYLVNIHFAWRRILPPQIFFKNQSL
jgi:hypothetical protein